MVGSRLSPFCEVETMPRFILAYPLRLTHDSAPSRVRVSPPKPSLKRPPPPPSSFRFCKKLERWQKKTRYRSVIQTPPSKSPTSDSPIQGSTASLRRDLPLSSTISPSLSAPATAASSSAPMAPVRSNLGKTTILKILGGKHMVEQSMVRVLGRSAFHDTALTSSGDLSYLGGEWRRDVSFAGFGVSIQMDVSAEKMIFGVLGIDPSRRDELIKVLDIDLSWRMHKASDGQRRRVQICMGLLKPFKVLLLDEITVDLDVLARADLLKFLRKECEDRGATIIYATHIFDGLEDWPSHIVYIAHGKLQLALPMEKVKEMSNLSLMRTVETWLRKEREEERKRRKERKANGLSGYEKRTEGSRVTGDPARSVVRAMNNGWAAGRLHSTIAGEENFFYSSNSVMRQ